MLVWSCYAVSQSFEPQCQRLYGTLHVCKCFLLFSVTEDHPEVKAMVLTALEEAKHISASPFGLYAEVLKTRIKEVCQKI